MRFKVGDRVKIKSLDWYNENKDEDGIVELSTHFFVPGMSQFCGKVVTIEDVFDNSYNVKEDSIKYSWTDEMIEGFAEEETSIKSTPIWPIHWNNVDLSEEIKCPDGYIFKDENDNVINTTKIILEKKKKEYPKTYEECCELLDGCSYNIMFDRCETSYEEFLHNKLLALRRIIICRDAYWKIAGEEMGLGKSWEPDWNTSEPKYVISCTSNGIEKQWETTYCKVLAFPTEEMRDAFYEAFREEIEICKELL